LDTIKSFELLSHEVNAQTFDEIALRLFRYQAQHNPVYGQYVKALRIQPATVTDVAKIPFLPIRFFKESSIKTGEWNEEVRFESSGTTGVATSQHAVFSVAEYCQHAQRIFEQEFGSLRKYHFLALLPSYLERGNSSLVAMIHHFIQETGSSFSGFYLHNQQQLLTDVEQLKKSDKKVILWGVTYALLDIAEQFAPNWQDVLVFETGGMKGRRKEITREALHETLKRHLKIEKVYSEYGMTELLSQAYSRGGNVFYSAPSMKVIVRDITDPMRKGLLHETGGINVIDLANFRTAAFIETEDLGKIDEKGHFEVLGRSDNSDVRGCNLLVE
jgi:hypothetical protein